MKKEAQISTNEAIEKAIFGHHKLLEKMVTEKRIRTIYSSLTQDSAQLVDRILSDIIKNSVYGTILWAKSLGQPLSSTFADAFVIKHFSEQKESWGTPGGVQHEATLTFPHPDPIKYDGPHDDSYYRVSFLGEGSAPGEGARSMITVDFATNIGWSSDPGLLSIGLFSGFREISPPHHIFVKDDGPIVLKPFKVSRSFLWPVA